MESDFSKVSSMKIKLISSSINSNGSIKGLFRGLVVGLIFSSFIAYIGEIDLRSSDVKNDAQAVKINDSFLQKNENMAEFMYRKVRVLCFILPISKSTLNERGDIFLKTWAKRCHIFIFFADEADDRFKENIVVLNDKGNNWLRLREALAYIYKHHMNDFDWILKANDNSFIVMENLRWLLYQYDADFPIAIGQRFLQEDYMMGVYAISRNAFMKLIENAFTNPEICDSSAYDGDKGISKCLQHVNVIQIDGIDDEKRGMFFINSPEPLLFPEKYDKDFDKWYWRKVTQGFNSCCSDRLIAIQNVANTHLYYMEYFIYKVHVFGRHRLPEVMPQRRKAEEVMKII